MTVQELMRAVAELSDDERRLLRQHIDQFPETAERLPPKEKMRRLNAALDAMSAGLRQAKLDEMTTAMTEDYTETWDESL